jgi:hypothetical protein
MKQFFEQIWNMPANDFFKVMLLCALVIIGVIVSAVLWFMRIRNRYSKDFDEQRARVENSIKQARGKIV